MFNLIKLKRYAKLFKFADEKIAEQVVIRQAKYLKINADLLLKSFIVVAEAMKEQEVEKASILKYVSKNLYILKYKDEIVDLYIKQKWGYLKISKAMKINHNANISKSAIENFIKSNKIEREAKNEQS